MVPIAKMEFRARRLYRVAIGLSCLLLGWVGTAQALPSFARQTGQPCTGCHVGAFGPQLTPFGREFKLRGYTMQGGDASALPVSAMLVTTYTHTAKAQDGPAGPYDGPNNNAALQELSVFGAGRISSHVGHRVRHQDLAGTGRVAEPDRELDGQPLIIPVVAEPNLADVHADAQPRRTRARRELQRERAPDRIGCPSERGDESVPAIPGGALPTVSSQRSGDDRFERARRSPDVRSAPLVGLVEFRRRLDLSQQEGHGSGRRQVSVHRTRWFATAPVSHCGLRPGAGVRGPTAESTEGSPGGHGGGGRLAAWQ